MTIPKITVVHGVLLFVCLFVLVFSIQRTTAFAQADTPTAAAPDVTDASVVDGGLFGATADKTNTLMANPAFVQTITEGMARARVTTVRVERLGIAAPVTTDGVTVGETVALNLFDGVELLAVRDQLQANPSGSYTWLGHIAGIPLSQATFVVRDNQLYGAVQVPGIGEFAVQPLDNFNHLIQQAGPNTILPNDDTHEVEEPAESSIVDTTNSADDAVGAAAATASTADSGSLIDVLVVYSDDVADANAQSFAELFTAYTNQAYRNSGVNQRIWLVDVERFVYNETGNLNSDLSNITNNANPNVGAYRNQLHADLVMFFVNNDGGSTNSCSGLAWLQTSVTLNFARNGFGVMKACSFGAGIFAHELGHNMGSRHDWYVDGGTTPYTYAHGYVDTVNRFRTIMSYNNRCNALGFSCTTIPYFSNPTVSYNGAVTGVAGGTAVACSPGNANPAVNCDADERRTFNSTAANTAAFRSSLLTWTGAVNTDWYNAGNWRINEGAPGTTVIVNRVPRAIDHVLIPAGVPRLPMISSGNATAREVVIASGATLNMSGGVLTVGWRWENVGGFVGAGGTVLFSGPIEIGVTAATTSTFANVQIGDGVSTPIVTLNSPLDINGNLTIKAGARLNASNKTIKLAGNWTDEGNGFSRDTSTVVLDGVNQRVDKVTTTTLLSQNFNSYTTCCTSAAPSGWARSQSNGFGFAFGSGEAHHWWDSTDAWLFTAGLALQPGITYQLSFKYLKGSASTSSLTLAYGAAQNASAMTNVFGTLTNLTTVYQTATFSFTPATAGTYYIGFHSLQTDGYNRLDDIVLQAVQPINFYNVTVRGSGSKTLTKNGVIYRNLQILSGATLDLATNTIAVEGSVTNNGALRQTRSVNAGQMTEFLRIKNQAGTLNRYYGVEITPVSNLGSTVVTIRGNQNCTEGGGATNTVKRCFVITPTTVQPAQMRLYYRTVEQNSEASPNVYSYTGSGTTWTLETLVGRGGSGNGLWVTATNIDGYPILRLDGQAVSRSGGTPARVHYMVENSSGEMSAASDRLTPLTVQAQPTCSDGTPPIVVDLLLATQRYPMQASNNADRTYIATVVLDQLTVDDSYGLDVEWQCADGNEPVQESLGVLHLFTAVEQEQVTQSLQFYLPLIKQ